MSVACLVEDYYGPLWSFFLTFFFAGRSAVMKNINTFREPSNPEMPSMPSFLNSLTIGVKNEEQSFEKSSLMIRIPLFCWKIHYDAIHDPKVIL